MPNDIDIITAPTRPASTQATAIEQARAVAEVQAAVVVAQQVPRDMGAAEADMRDACSKVGMANRAFYQVVNRGSGPTVHLARELARIFGNVQYGVHELRRDDALGMSEIQAFAWDVEKNVRSTRTFQVPHQRMKGGKRQPLTDLGDVYLNNQNVGARAVRECIFTVLPAWFTDAAMDLCHETLVKGVDGKPLADRVADMVRVFAELGVTVDQLEDKIGRKRSAWQPVDIAQMTIVYTSIKRGEITKDDAFPVKLITADEILSDAQKPAAVKAAPEPAPSTPRGSTDDAKAEAPTPGAPQSVEASPEQQQTRRPSGERRVSAEPEPDQAATEEPSSGEAAGPEVAAGRATGPRCTITQQAEINRHFSRLEVEDMAERLWWINHLAGLDVATVDATKQLKQAEAVKVIAALETFTTRDQLDASINQDSLLGDQS